MITVIFFKKHIVVLEVVDIKESKKNTLVLLRNNKKAWAQHLSWGGYYYVYSTKSTFFTIGKQLKVDLYKHGKYIEMSHFNNIPAITLELYDDIDFEPI